MASNVSEVGGYDFEFLCEPPDVLQCLICHSVAREPLQHEECGKLFCKSCLEKYKKQSKVCPNCRGENAQYFRDTRGNQEIQELKIKCVNGHLGCDWTGELRAVEEHLTSCPYSMVTCTNKCLTSDGEEYKCSRKDLDQHLKEKCPKRKFKCPYCQKKGTYKERTTTHLETCPEVPTKCPNEDCDEELPAKKIKEHFSDVCPFTMKSCKYENIGCTAKISRKDLAKHEGNNMLHFHIIINTVAKQQEQLAVAQREIQSLRLQTSKPQESPMTRTYKLTEYQKKQDTNEYFDFPSFYSSPNGYHMNLRVYPNGQGDCRGKYVSAYLPLIKGDHDDKLKWPFTGTVTFELLNQLADEDHHIHRMYMNTDKKASIGDSWGIATFIPHSKLSHDPVLITQYLKDDTLYFRVSVNIVNKKPWLEFIAVQ